MNLEQAFQAERDLNRKLRSDLAAAEAALERAREALREFDRLSRLGPMLSKPGGPDVEGVSRLFALGTQLEKLRAALGLPSQLPAPAAEQENKT